MKSVVAIVALGAALALAGASRGGSTWDPGHGILLVGRANYGKSRILLWRPGSPPKPIGPAGYGVRSPQWSPDGRSIVFENAGSPSHQNQHIYIYLMRPDGTHVTLLTHDSSNWAPSWSPDGRQIVFVKQLFDSNFTTIFATVNVSTGHERRLSGAADDSVPVWGKPGIAYLADAIYLLNPETRRSRLVTRRVSWGLDWSPSGVLAALKPKRITFFSAAGRVLNELPAPVGTTLECSPVWSPNGKQILANATNGVWVGTVSTKHWQRLAISDKYSCVADWR